MAEAVSSNYDISCFQRLLQSSLRLLRNLYSRDIRRQYTPDGHWISPKKTFTFGTPANFKFAIQQRGHLYREFLGIRHLNREEISVYGPPIPVKDIVAATVIQELPFVVPFFDRVAIVQSMIAHEKRERENLHYELFANNTVNIRRNFLYEDGFNKLSEEVMPNLKAMIRIKLFSALNMEETGVDGGGVFREFITEIIKTAFDPNLGFFSLTKNGLLYPNPAVEAIEPHSNRHYYFIGRLLGKALYENILTDLPLAPFFLEKLLTTGSDVDINHLASLDPELYKHLISLRNFPGNVADLSLDFTVVTSNLGHNKVIELKPKGGEILVTNENRIEYIHLMADYKLNKQVGVFGIVVVTLMFANLVVVVVDSKPVHQLQERLLQCDGRGLGEDVRHERIAAPHLRLGDADRFDRFAPAHRLLEWLLGRSSRDRHLLEGGERVR